MRFLHSAYFTSQSHRLSTNNVIIGLMSSSSRWSNHSCRCLMKYLSLYCRVAVKWKHGWLRNICEVCDTLKYTAVLFEFDDQLKHHYRRWIVAHTIHVKFYVLSFTASPVETAGQTDRQTDTYMHSTVLPYFVLQMQVHKSAQGKYQHNKRFLQSPLFGQPLLQIANLRCAQ